MSNTLFNGQDQRLAIPAGQSLGVNPISGTYSAAIVAGAANLPVILASSSAAAATFGPYATGVEIFLDASPVSQIVYDVAVSPDAGTPGAVSAAVLRPLVTCSLGDSMTAQNYSLSPSAVSPASTLSSAFSNRSWLAWLNDLTAGSMTLAYVGGVGGDRTDQIYARLQTALSFNPDLIFDFAGTNNIAQYNSYAPYGNSLATAVDALVSERQAAWTTMQKAGVCVVALSVLPPTTGTVFIQAQADAICRANRRLATIAATMKNVRWVDLTPAFIDPTSTTGYGLSSLYYDGLHPMGYPLAKRLLDVLGTALLRPNAVLVSSRRDCVQVDAASLNVIEAQDGLFLRGTAGTASTGVTGTVASNWFASRINGSAATATASVVAAPSGIGSAQKLDITATAAEDNFRVFLGFAPNLTQLPAGSRVRVRGRVDVVNTTGLRAIYAAANRNTSGGANAGVVSSYDGQDTPADPAIPAGATFTRYFDVPLLTIPADATGITQMRAEFYAVFSGAGSASITVSQVSMEKA
ncbi:MAG: hypothetical protein EOO23_01680 [Comamonadaceae bacterium]|nr:MAG: hypothetical protein EOO23_01680 [Comamonadaceae bacterium]